MDKKFYITTTLPYVNSDPHLGFALEIVQADVIARYHQLLGEDVVFNFGTDEHGIKIYRKAQELGKDVRAYCDEYAAKFDSLKKALNLSYTNFIRTTDGNHIAAAQEFWKRCLKNGDIYKKNYKIKYCVGCELEKTDSELIDGKCEFHPNLEIENYEEENYFFRFSKYQQPLLDFYDKHPDFVIPDGKFNEIREFVKRGLEDFSVSRLKSKMPWGIDVPGDRDHVMFVWFDALINYISTLGWPENDKNFKDFWPGLQVAGKDNLRQQTAIWQAMLMSAELPNSKQVFIHGFLTVDGQKISKSLGNTINPIEVSEKYGIDAIRYYLLAKVHPWEDSDFTFNKFEESYNADLANGLGNLVARVAKLCETGGFEKIITTPDFVDIINYTEESVWQNPNEINLDSVQWLTGAGLKYKFDHFRFNEIIILLTAEVSRWDETIEKNKPWALIENQKEVLYDYLEKYVTAIQIIAVLLQPFLPETAEKILEQFKGPSIKSGASLFPRIK